MGDILSYLAVVGNLVIFHISQYLLKQKVKIKLKFTVVEALQKLYCIKILLYILI